MLWSGDQSLAQHHLGRHSLCCGVGTSHWHSIRLVGIVYVVECGPVIGTASGIVYVVKWGPAIGTASGW